MNSKRSFLDNLNAGRQRRPDPSFDDLDRTLADLEGKLQRSRESAFQMRAGSGRGDASAQAASFGKAAQPRYAQPAERSELRALARDLEATRRQEDGLSSVGKIAAELKAMREDLRQQMDGAVKREFEALRHDIHRLYTAAPTINGAELGAEFDRLSDAVQSLAARSDDKTVNLLRLELEEVKDALNSVAREETVRSVGRRWDDFDRRWTKIENRIGAMGPSLEPNLAALNRQLEQISRTVDHLPESLSVRSLEDRLKTLSGSIEQFAQQYGSTMPDAFALIEQRLDEITRAIVASASVTQTVTVDQEPFQRIEARVSSLARQIDELMDERGPGEIIDRLNRLSQRVDEIAQRVEVPETIVARLADQIANISSKLERSPAASSAEAMFQTLEDRFVQLSGLLERRQDDAIAQGHKLFQDLERRLEDFAARMDGHVPGADIDQQYVLDTIDARFAELSAHLDARASLSDGNISHQLEQRLEDISYRLEQSAKQAAGIDPGLVRNLETQIATLSKHLAHPAQTLPEFEDMAPRLDQLERSLANSREAILEAARKAAHEAVSTLSHGADQSALTGLADDLKSLDQLTRRSDDRNAKTFEAIHDTLLKIVERLGTFEQSGPDSRQSKVRMSETPSIDVVDDVDSFGGERIGRAGSVSINAPSPAEAAAAAASHAISSDEAEWPTESSSRSISMLSGLARAFRKDKGAPQTELPSSELEPAVGLGEPLDARLANQPIEPGSGAPDINAIIRRVRDEHAGVGGSGSETARADFIAAARRAAQAAAAEAQTMKSASEKGGGAGKLKIGEMFRTRRKTLLLAATAVVVVLGGMQLGKAFLSGETVAPAEISSTGGEAASPALKAEAVPEVAAKPIESLADQEHPQPVPDQQAVISEPAPSEPALTPTPATEVSTDEPSPTETASVVPNASESRATSTSVSAPKEVANEALRDAADGSDPKAMFEIGSRYAEGRGVTVDMKSAASWYERAAELGYAPAEYRLGSFYEKGIGVDKDAAKAKSWYEKAAKQGNASAMHNLAVLYATGADGKPDNDAAARWFLEAAELGVKDSQYNLGILAAKGVGMPQSLEESYKWFALVAKTGDRDAAAKRDEVAKALRPEQLAKAKAAAELWRARDVDPETNIVDIPEEWREAGQAAGLDIKQAMTGIQSILNKNGYDAGTADGVMGQKTRNAIMAFQADNGMKADGELSEELVRKLLARK